MLKKLLFCYAINFSYYVIYPATLTSYELCLFLPDYSDITLLQNSYPLSHNSGSIIAFSIPAANLTSILNLPYKQIHNVCHSASSRECMDAVV